MDSVMTPDGVFYIRDTQKDFSDLCRKYISDEAADYIDAVIADIDSENEYQRNVFQSDFKALEQEVEEYRNELDELNSQLQQLSVKADEPGMSKKKIVAEIDKMWRHLQSIL